MRAARPKSNRRGLTAAAVLVCLMVLTLISGVLVRQGVVHREQVRAQERRLQAEWLVESGVDRAFARLAAKPEYKGERWEIAAGSLGRPAIVTIEVVPPASPNTDRVVRVSADYPSDSPLRVRSSREAVVPTSH